MMMVMRIRMSMRLMLDADSHHAGGGGGGEVHAEVRTTACTDEGQPLLLLVVSVVLRQVFPGRCSLGLLGFLGSVCENHEDDQDDVNMVQVQQLTSSAAWRQCQLQAGISLGALLWKC